MFLDRVVAEANAPTYSWVDSTMGRGIVGGSLKKQEAEIEAVANLAVRVLQGEHTDKIPVAFVDVNSTQIDWRQLSRWNIDVARVPANAVVLFKEPSAFERYRSVVLGALGLVLAQAGLITLLLLQNGQRRRAEAALRTSYDRIKDLGGRLLLAQDSERFRIAQELHDDVGQQLAMLAIDLELIAGTSSDAPGDCEPLLTETLARARAVSQSVRDLSHRLHPEALQAVGLISAVRRLSREFSRPNLAITFTDRDVPNALSPSITLCLYRIAQEALLNIVKHSGANHVTIQLIGAEDHLVLRIEDDGRGYEPETVSGKGLGLVTMAERAEAAGGKLNIVSRPQAGTRLQVFVPTRHRSSPESPVSRVRPEVMASVP